ncbi:hypothetical protein VTN00DRAFT_9441 [Thermoascus crustaceus]|uniref:uncharacterized protein n=1 Tax=Thermoascus crustaceus TaxID=5088 RepID=UPI003744873C
MNMERQSSRRRKPAPVEEQQPEAVADQPSVRGPEQPAMQNAVQNQPLAVLFSSLVVCLLIAFVSIGSDDGRSLALLSPGRHGSGHVKSHGLNLSPSILQLHPEDHVFREPVIQHLDWRITSGDRRPDGVKKRVYLINDLFPGPTVEARSSDTLIISVKNDLQEESISVHWHGLHMRNANSMDGVVGVTQCAILPGTSFTYNFTIPADQSGTFWYHAHSAVQRADGLYGGLVVHKPAFKPAVRGLMSRDSDERFSYGYDKEILLLIGDWYHRPAEGVLSWYLRAGSYGNEPVPDSLVVNGAGSFNCSMAIPARPVDCIDNLAQPRIDLDPRKTYRVRVVNTGSLAGFTLSWGRENLELIQLDGIPVEPQFQEEANSAGILFPGQRMDFILRRPAETVNEMSFLTVELDQGCFNYPNPALNPIQTFLINDNGMKNQKHEKPPVPEHHPTSHHIDIEKISSATSVLAALPPKAQQTHVVYTKIEKLARNHNIPYGFFNRTSWRPQSDPPVPLIALPRQKWDRNQLAISTGPEPVWVDLVVNNLDEGPHPFHLHGHNFYVLTIHESTIGWGSYNPFEDPSPPGLAPNPSSTDDNNSNSDSPYDLSRAVLRDTVQIPRRGHAVLRFRADNPGVWLFHCHILWHLAGGMAMLVDVMGDAAGMEAHDPSLSSSWCD